MKAQTLKVAVPADMDKELATLSACKALLDRLGDLKAARRVLDYLDKQLNGPLELDRSQPAKIQE